MTSPPHDPQAEKSLLGAVLTSASCIPEVACKVAAEDFYLPRNELVFSAALSLHNEGSPVDPTTVASELDRRKQLVRIGGAPYLADLIKTPITGDAAPYFAGLVASKARLRKIGQLGVRLQQATEMDADDCIEAVHRFMDSVDVDKGQAGKSFSELYEEWEEWRDSEENPIPTPWMGVNRNFNGGLYPGRLYLVGARPGAGKTVFGLNCAIRAAMAGFRSMVFELEMPSSEITSRILAAGAQVPLSDIVRRRVTRDDLGKIQEWRRMWGAELEKNLCIDDGASHTIESIMAECRAQKRNGLDFVFIDYAGLLSASDASLMRYQQVEWISKQAKLMARRLDVAVLLACQLNRSSETENRKPRMSDLRESGGLEADSDVICLLTRSPDADKVAVNIVKNRVGVPDVTVMLKGRFECARLES